MGDATVIDARTENMKRVWGLVDFNPIAARNVIVSELLVRKCSTL